MKNKIGSTLITCLLSLAAHATEVKTVKTPFWQAPQITKLDFELSPVESELNTECVRFHRLMFTSTGEPFPQSVERFVRFRSTPLISAPMGVSQFESHFTVLQPEKLFRQVETFYRDQKVVLPFYYQEKAYTDVYLGYGLDAKVKVINEERSIYKIAQQIGAPETEMQMLSSHEGPSIKILGKDIACDLILGHITLEVKSPATVQLLTENANKMEEFYRHRITKSVNKAVAKKTTSPMRLGARLGGFFGEDLLNELGNKFEDRIEVIEELLDLLFVPGTVKPSSNLADFGGKYLVNFSYTADAADVSVSMRIKQ
jgi:hypothetical protein